MPLAVLAGAAVGVLLFFVPGSTLLGGGITGYLVDERGGQAATAGGMAGAVMVVPTALLVLLLGSAVLGIEPLSGGLLVVGLVVLAVYTVLLGVLGGILGGYARGALADEDEPSVDTANVPRGSTLLHGVVGGVAGVFLSFIPYSTVLGGGIAGYLEGGSLRDGAVVGAVAGVVALVPFILLGLFVISVLGLFGGVAGAAVGVVLVAVIGAGLVYVVGLSIVGGVVGAYLKSEVG